MNKKQYESNMPTSTEKIFGVVMLLYAMGAPLPLLMGETDAYSIYLQNPKMNLMHLAFTASLYLVMFSFIAVRWRRVLQSTRKIKWIVALVLMAVASVMWSQDPSLTLRRCALLIATTAFGVYFGSRYTVPQQLRLLAWTCFLVVSLSFFLAIFLPGYGMDQDLLLGAWRGVFVQKNALARAMVLAVLVFVFVRPKRFPSLRWLGVAASLALLFLARSVTGMIVCAGLIAMFPLYRLMRSRLTVLIPVGACLLVVGWLLFQNFTVAEALERVDKSPDLTGRVELWSALLLPIAERPWLGYGYSAFWLGPSGESGWVQLAISYPANHGQNGFFDLMLDLGALGLATFAVGYLVLWRRALGFLSRVPGPVPGWLCTYLVFMLLYNLTESSLMTQHDVYWVLYTSTAVSLFPASFRQVCTSPNG
jgi:O-antigen ligase